MIEDDLKRAIRCVNDKKPIGWHGPISFSESQVEIAISAAAG